jgi:hydrogenase nickel incorporation protein HypB
MMCTTCGCGSNEMTIDGADVHDHSHDAPHSHEPGHAHAHAHFHSHGGEHGTQQHPPAPSGHQRTISLEQDVLAKNQLLAERNRGWFAGREVFAVNLMSSPGSGKTSILERTIGELKGEIPISVLEGDQATSSDADRIRATGAAVVQINTGTGCHLDAHMVAHGVEGLDLSRGAVLLIENVGNLVCPALFDLGENARVVVVSVTEGDDKPLKYPHMFRSGQMLLINKIDLLPYVRFDMARCIEHAHRINPELQVLTLSAETGEGMPDWYDWLRARSPGRGMIVEPPVTQHRPVGQ